MDEQERRDKSPSLQSLILIKKPNPTELHAIETRVTNRLYCRDAIHRVLNQGCIAILIKLVLDFFMQLNRIPVRTNIATAPLCKQRGACDIIDPQNGDVWVTGSFSVFLANCWLVSRLEYTG